MSFPYINAYQQFFDSSGAPLASGTIEFRDPTSLNLINTYPTAAAADAQTPANANPLTLSASGAASAGIFLEDGVKYKVILKDVNGDTVATHDNVVCPTDLWHSRATSAETTAGVTPVDFSYPPGDVRRYGAVGNGSTDDSGAFQTAINTGHNVIAPEIGGGGYKIDTTLTFPRNRVVMDIYDDVISGVATGNAVFKVDGGYARHRVTCYKKVTGQYSGGLVTDYCVHYEWGINCRFTFNWIQDFTTALYFKQAAGGFAAGHSLVENIIDYQLISACNDGVVFSNTTGESRIPMEGVMLNGGFIATNDNSGVTIEDNTNAKYLVINGAIDNQAGSPGTHDYRCLSSNQQSSILFIKYIRPANTTLGDGDMVFNPQNGRITINSETPASQCYKFVAKNGTAQPATSAKYIGESLGGTTGGTEYTTIMAGSDGTLGASHATNIQGYYDPGTTATPAASEAKKAGFLATYRRNDDASAIEGGRLEFAKRSAANTVDLTIDLMNSGTSGTKLYLGADGSFGLSNSAANTNTPSGATAHQLPIYNEAGTLLGYIPIYGSAW